MPKRKQSDGIRSIAYGNGSSPVFYSLDINYIRCILRQVDVYRLIENGRRASVVEVVRWTHDTRGLIYYAIRCGQLSVLTALVKLGCSWEPLPHDHPRNELPSNITSAYLFSKHAAARVVLLLHGYLDAEKTSNIKIHQLYSYITGQKRFISGAAWYGGTDEILLRYNRTAIWLEKNAWRIVGEPTDIIAPAISSTLRSGRCYKLNRTI